MTLLLRRTFVRARQSAGLVWKNASRSVGHSYWLTGLGPPVVFAHAGGPPRATIQGLIISALPPSRRTEGQIRAPNASGEPRSSTREARVCARARSHARHSGARMRL